MVKFWKHLIGDLVRFDIEVRIFHSVCILVAIALCINVPYNYLMGLSMVAMVMTGILLGVIGIYYNSRVRGKFKSSVNLFQVFNHVLLVILYLQNSGAYGPCYGMFIVSFLISVVIVPKRYYWLWLPLNIFAILTLLYLEAKHPGFITDNYPSRYARYFDFGFTYLFITGTIMLVATYTREALQQQHFKVLEKASVLAVTNRTKDKLLSVLAHDLKEPLASVQGFLELLAEYDLNDTERIDIQRQLLSRTKDTSYLLANVLAWTRGQMEAVEVNVSSLNLKQTLDPTLKLVKGIAQEKQLKLDYDLNDKICVLADKDLIQLVIRNLVINAIKFTYPGGRIGVSAEQRDTRCLIYVSDTGSGIPQVKQAQIFSLAAASTFGTHKEKGAGLGLVLCKEFTEMQGGQIGFTSKENEGSTFFIDMPLCGNFIGTL